MTRNVRPLQLTVLHIFDETLRLLDEYDSTLAERHFAQIYSVQGFGLLRLYIRRIGRLHVWDSALRYDNVSMIHNHSWDLRSTIVAGRLLNTRYEVDPLVGEPHDGIRMITGYDCRQVAAMENVRLLRQPHEIYQPGDVYAQAAHVLHRTDADDGTITLMERTEDENGEADIYWPRGGTWGTARPRVATPDEVRTTIGKAIASLEASI